MRRTACYLFAVLFTLSLVIPGLIPINNANATSSYDHVIKPTDSLVISNSDKSCARDLSMSWASDFRNFLSGDRLASFDDREAWAVSIWYDGMQNYNPAHVNIYWWDSANLPATATFSQNTLNQSGAQVGYMYLPYGQCDLEAYFPAPQGDMPVAQYMWNSYSLRPFLAYGVNIDYPAGYEGILIPTEPPPVRYVAMGDSFSSGEGVEPFEHGTDTSTNKCHRSTKAYPRLLQADASLNLGSAAFVACSGATTSDVINGKNGEDSQLDALSEDTEVVTITIGGNDVGFADFAKKCVSPLNPPSEDVCDEYTDVYDQVTDSIANSLPEKLEDVYSELLDKAPNADIYVVGYPQIAPYKVITDSFDQECGGLYDEWPNTWGDARAAHEVVSLLNGAIQDAADDVNTQNTSTRLHYIDVSSGAFIEHDICSSDSYFNGIDVFNPEYSVHPNENGQIAYKEDIADELS